ncbi:tripartite tricarboxylate transporter substrate binding protein [Acidaminococcus sp. LBK-2]|uniref:tripartite tricarboxylate transporter substrate binding protein n=1 Tax=Acidaminococcus sp. LBK-2 TaxID=3456956 RepID=UPI003FA47499
MKKALLLLVAAAMLLSVTGCVGKNTQSTGQTSKSNWPKKAVNFIVGYAAGGDSDMYARTIAKYMAKKTGGTFIVTNTTGAGGANALVSVSSAAPDGYTFLWNHDGCLVNEALGNAPVSYLKDVDIGCGVLTDNSYTVVVNKSTGIHNYEEFITYAKANPQKLTINVNTNSNGMDIIRKFENAAGISLKYVEGSGSATERIASCLGGHTDVVYANYSLLADYVKNGDFYIIGSLGAKPMDAHPEVPCLSNLTGHKIESPYIFGFRYPKGINANITTYFENMVQEITKDPEFIADINKLGGNVTFIPSAEHKKFQEAEIEAIRKRLGGK